MDKMENNDKILLQSFFIVFFKCVNYFSEINFNNLLLEHEKEKDLVVVRQSNLLKLFLIKLIANNAQLRKLYMVIL